MHGGGCVAGGVHGRGMRGGGMHGREHAWWGACVVGEGMCCQGSHFSGLTKFPDFSSIFCYVSSIF